MTQRLQQLRRQALALGFDLAPLSPTVAKTVHQVKQGYDTKAAIADVNGIGLGAAIMRLKAAAEKGFLVALPQIGKDQHRFEIAEDL